MPWLYEFKTFCTNLRHVKALICGEFFLKNVFKTCKNPVFSMSLESRQPHFQVSMIFRSRNCIVLIFLSAWWKIKHSIWVSQGLGVCFIIHHKICVYCFTALWHYVHALLYKGQKYDGKSNKKFNSVRSFLRNECLKGKSAVCKHQHMVDGVNECTQTEREILYICGPSVAALTTTVMRMARVKSMDNKDTWNRGRERVHNCQFNLESLLYHFWLNLKFLRSLNDQHDKNFAEIPVVHNLLHAFCCLIDSLDFFRK